MGNKPTKNAATTTDKPALTSFADAHEKYKDIIMRVPDSALLPINVDVPSVVTLVCGAWPQIAAMRAQVAELPQIDMAEFDRVLDLALALGHTQSLYLAVNGPTVVLPPLAAEAQKARDVLLDEVRLLAKRGLLDAGFTASFQGGPSYKAVAFELLALVNCLRALPEAAAARMRATAEELDAAEAVARSMTQEVGARDQAPVTAASAAHERQQAFTLAAHGYDQARRAIMFLRWNEGDADEIAPSLYAGRGGRRTAEDVVSPTVPVPVVAPVVTPTATPKPRIEPGMPGSSPFLSNS
jgi:hypothetical protein